MNRGKFLTVIFALYFVFFFSSCKTEHNVAVDVNKPIKIEARIDIYLHAETIEDMVSGKKPIPEAEDDKGKNESFLHRYIDFFFGVKEAYGAEIPFKKFTKEIRSAIERRKNRFSKIEKLKNSGKIKEGDNGYLVIIGKLNDDEKKLVKDENNDRKFIYLQLAKQNNLKLSEVEKAFGKIHKKKK